MAAADYVIVGSGINALVAAALLGRKGHKVLLLERSDRIGTHGQFVDERDDAHHAAGPTVEKAREILDRRIQFCRARVLRDGAQRFGDKSECVL